MSKIIKQAHQGALQFKAKMHWQVIWLTHRVLVLSHSQVKLSPVAGWGNKVLAVVRMCCYT